MLVDVGSGWLARRFAQNDERRQTKTYLYSDGVNDRTTVSAGPTLG